MLCKMIYTCTCTVCIDAPLSRSVQDISSYRTAHIHVDGYRCLKGLELVFLYVKANGCVSAIPTGPSTCKWNWHYVITQYKSAAQMDHLLGAGWMVSGSCDFSRARVRARTRARIGAYVQ